MKREIINLNPEVRDLLKGTEYAKVVTDMHRLSQQSDDVQLAVANLLIVVSTEPLREHHNCITI